MAHERDNLANLSCKDGTAHTLQELIAKTLGDSRVVEVAHQQGPDLKRTNRHNQLPNVSIMHGTIMSGALELRKVQNTVKVDPQELVYTSKNWRNVKLTNKLDPSKHKLDSGLQRMMRRRQGANFWHSPAPASLFPSLAATEWAFSHLKAGSTACNIEDSWISCIAGGCGDLIAH